MTTIAFFGVLAVVAFIWQERYSKPARFYQMLRAHFPTEAETIKSQLGMRDQAIRFYIMEGRYKKLSPLPAEMEALVERLIKRYNNQMLWQAISPAVLIAGLILLILIRKLA